MALVYLVFSVSGSLYGVGEKTISLSGDSLLKMAGYRNGITDVSLVRPGTVLVLSSSTASVYTGIALDLAISFDEGNPSLFRDSSGHYRITAGSSLVGVDRRYARAGYGAALFSGASRAGNAVASAPLVLEAQNRGALFASDNRIGDFTLE